MTGRYSTLDVQVVDSVARGLRDRAERDLRWAAICRRLPGQTWRAGLREERARRLRQTADAIDAGLLAEIDAAETGLAAARDYSAPTVWDDHCAGALLAALVNLPDDGDFPEGGAS
jgi:hypothetical protein